MMYVRLCLRLWLRIFSYGLFLGTLLPVPVQAQTLSWKRQLGTSGNDFSRGVATDSKGNVYASGYTTGSLGGTYQGGYNDAWVAKYKSSGSLVWKRQLGTSSEDISNGVATDSNGNIYISGQTSGSLGGSSQGAYDAWIAKYKSSGTLVWKRQLGTSRSDISNGVATDSNGNIYISGQTYGSLGGTNQGELDAWVAKYKSSGALVWKRQLGTSSFDVSNSIATDGNGNIYISGWTQGSLGGVFQGLYPDAWVAKYNSSGTLVWKQQLGTAGDDVSNGVATDSNGNVYISGYTDGSLGGSNQGFSDAWVAKYKSSGALVWKRQLGTSSGDFSYGVATDSNGNVYTSGYTGGSLEESNQGELDAWVAKGTTDGVLVWKRQLGTSSNDYCLGVATDSNSNVYISGYTGGSLGGSNQGADDAWLAKYNH